MDDDDGGRRRGWKAEWAYCASLPVRFGLLLMSLCCCGCVAFWNSSLAAERATNERKRTMTKQRSEIESVSATATMLLTLILPSSSLPYVMLSFLRELFNCSLIIKSDAHTSRILLICLLYKPYHMFIRALPFSFMTSLATACIS